MLLHAVVGYVQHHAVPCSPTTCHGLLREDVVVMRDALWSTVELRGVACLATAVLYLAHDISVPLHIEEDRSCGAS